MQTEVIPATGHNWQTVTEVVPAVYKTVTTQLYKTELHAVAHNGFDMTAAGFNKEQILEYLKANNVGYANVGVKVPNGTITEQIEVSPATTKTVTKCKICNKIK